MKTVYSRIFVDGIDVMDHTVNLEQLMSTLGEYRVGVDFNPSKNHGVDEVKAQAAALIDFIDQIPDAAEGEIRRLKAEAMTCVETGAMYAVKALTKQSR